MWTVTTVDADAFKDTRRTPAVLHSVHQAVERTWHWQAKLGTPRSDYYWLADRHSSPAWLRARIARSWWDKAHAAYEAYRDRPRSAAVASGVPAWFVAAMPCLATREEYGPPWEGGYTTSAGYFGMISPPSAYPGSGGVVATYGDGWMNIPWDAQIVIVYAEWLAYGSSPWPNTAPYCGL